MFEREIGHANHGLIGGITICFDDDGTSFGSSGVELPAEFVDRSSLIAEVDRFSIRDADDLIFDLWGKHELREGHVHRNAWLQNKIRTQQQEKNHQENDVEQREDQQPAELIIFCSNEFHGAYFSRRRSRWFVSAWKEMIPLSGSVSVSMCTISIPARSMSCIMVFTRDER